MKEIYAHTAKITNLVHDELIGWVGGLLKDAGLESVDVWGRFPPEGTVRSHLVLFPYRVGPEPKNLENARGASIMTHEAFASDKVGKVPVPWRNLGHHLLDSINLLFPEAGYLDTPARPAVMPYPRVDDLPEPLREWYAKQPSDVENPFVVREDGEAYARPPSLRWKPGLSLWAHYIAVAGDAGRGVSDRTSDAPPLSLGALSVLSVGIQLQRLINVELPPMPFSDDLRRYLEVVRDALGQIKTAEAEILHQSMVEALLALDRVATYQFGVIPVHDLSMHEFALLTQALQRPLQAVLNFRLQFSLGDVPEFLPSAVVSMRNARNPRDGLKERR
jgi:hypothetical protein